MNRSSNHAVPPAPQIWPKINLAVTAPTGAVALIEYWVQLTVPCWIPTVIDDIGAPTLSLQETVMLAARLVALDFIQPDNV